MNRKKITIDDIEEYYDIFYNFKKHKIYTRTTMLKNVNHHLVCDGVCLFVHGFSGHYSGRFNEPRAIFIERNITCIGFDLPNHGLSDGTRGEINDLGCLCEAMRFMIAHILHTYSNKPVFIVSTSFGSAITLLTLNKHPELQKYITKLILVSPLFSLSNEIYDILSSYFKSFTNSLIFVANKIKRFIPIWHCIPFKPRENDVHVCENYDDISSDVNGIDACHEQKSKVSIKQNNDFMTYHKYPVLDDKLLYRDKLDANTALTIYNISDLLKDVIIPIPTLIVHGNGDKVTDPCISKEYFLKLAKQNIECRYAEVDTVNHYLLFHSRDIFKINEIDVRVPKTNKQCHNNDNGCMEYLPYSKVVSVSRNEGNVLDENIRKETYDNSPRNSDESYDSYDSDDSYDPIKVNDNCNIGLETRNIWLTNTTHSSIRMRILLWIIDSSP